jgi:hypothetical protein
MCSRHKGRKVEIMEEDLIENVWWENNFTLAELLERLSG